MSIVEIDTETILELYDSPIGSTVDAEWGGWRLERVERLRDSDWYSNWKVVVSRENEWLVREYYRGKFRRGLTDHIRANDLPPATLSFTEVHPVTRTITVTEYLSSDGAVLA